MHNSDEPPNQKPQEPTDIEVHFSVKVSESAIKTAKAGIGATIKVLVSMLAPFLLNAHNLNGRDLLQFPVWTQQPAEELQIPKEVSK